MIDVTPPNALATEQALLGAILTDAASLDEVSDTLRPDDFYADSHQRIYRHLCGCWRRSSGVDLTAMLTSLRKSNELKAVGEEAYLAEVMQKAGLPVMVKAYAAEIVELAEKREIIKIAGNAVARAYESDATPQELRRTLEDVLLDNENRTDKPVMDAAAWSMQLTEYLESEDSNRFVPSGYSELDRLLNGGFRAGQVIIVAARPGIGKSALMLSFALHAATVECLPVGVMSMEMSSEELIMRAVSSMANVSLSRIISKTLNASEQAEITQAQRSIAESRMFIDDNVHKTVVEIESTARRLVRKYGLRIMFIDYLGLIESDDKRANTIERTTRNSRLLKSMSRVLGIPVVVLCQLNRESDKVKHGRKTEPTLKDLRPNLHNLRDSGAIEQDADVVLFVHRKRDEPETELILGKQRNGQTGIIDLWFDGPHVRFDEVEQPEPPRIDEFARYGDF